jgi:hypothetical protein
LILRERASKRRRGPLSRIREHAAVSASPPTSTRAPPSDRPVHRLEIQHSRRSSGPMPGHVLSAGLSTRRSHPLSREQRRRGDHPRIMQRALRAALLGVAPRPQRQRPATIVSPPGVHIRSTVASRLARAARATLYRNAIYFPPASFVSAGSPIGSLSATVPWRSPKSTRSRRSRPSGLSGAAAPWRSPKLRPRSLGLNERRDGSLVRRGSGRESDVESRRSRTRRPKTQS